MGEISYNKDSIGVIQPSAVATGAFKVGSSKDKPVGASQYMTGAGLGFDASLSNDIYSGSDLQIPAIQCLVCIKF